jgi:hypothetical protein
MEHICHFPEQWQCASLEKHKCACDAIGISTVFSSFFFQLAWFSLTNLLFDM